MFFLSVILVLVFFCEPLLMGKHIFFGDFTYIFYPYHKTLARAFASGEFPLWNPLNSLGVPFVGDPQSHALYPPAWIFLILPFESCFQWFVFLHYCVAAVGMYLLLRRWGLSSAAAIVGGVIFGYNGFMVSDHLFGHHYSAVYLPLVFFAVLRARERPTAGNVGLAGMAVAFQVTAGEVQLVYFTLILLAVYLLVDEGWGLLGKTAWKRLLFAACAVVFGLLLSAPFLLPVWKFMASTMRFSEVDFGFATQWSVHPLCFYSMVTGNPFGYYEIDNFYWMNFLMARGEKQPSAASLYFGVLALLLVLRSCRRRDRRWYFFAGAGVVLAVLAMGAFTPVYAPFFNYFPLVKRFNYPFKFLLFFYFAAAYLAAAGFEEILKKTGETKRENRILLAQAGVAFALLTVGHWAAKLILVGRVPQDSELFFESTDHLSRVYYMSLLILAISAGALFAARKWAAKNSVIEYAIILLLSAELVFGSWGCVWAIPADEYRKTPELVELIRKYGGKNTFDYRIYWTSEFMPQEWMQRKGFERLVSFNRWKQEFIQPNTNQLYGFQSPWFYISYLPGNYRDMIGLFTAMPDMTLDLFNVKYVYSSVPLEEDRFLSRGSGGYRFLGMTELGLRLFENPDTFPKAYWAGAPRFAENDEKSREIIFTAPGDLRVSPVITGAPGGEGKRVKLGEAGTTKIESYTMNRVGISVESGADGYVVLLDSYDPDWAVFVDGKREKLYRANYFFRGVRVARGEHFVEFRYRPRYFYAGLMVAGAAAGVWGLLLLMFRKRR